MKKWTSSKCTFSSLFVVNAALWLDSCLKWTALSGYPSNVVLTVSDNNWFAWTPAVFFFSSLQFLFGVYTIQRQLSVFPLFSNLSRINALITETMDSKIRLIVSWQEMWGAEYWRCFCSNTKGETRELMQQQDRDAAEERRMKLWSCSLVLVGGSTTMCKHILLYIRGVWLNCSGPPTHMQNREES